jgi:hypothetical protein
MARIGLLTMKLTHTKIKAAQPERVARDVMFARRAAGEGGAMKRDTLPSTLLHGTSTAAIDAMLRDGILPRGKTGRDNYRHSVGSNPRSVYLSTCYALHFAYNAAGPGADPVVVEVDVASLPEGAGKWHALHADEDALEQANRGRDDLPADWNMKRRTTWYRQRAHMYRAIDSLNVMGTCAYRGTIPAGAILRYCIVPRDRVMRLILAAFDPLICIDNFRIIGERHAQFHRWLMGDDDVCEAAPGLTREGFTVISNKRIAA